MKKQINTTSIVLAVLVIVLGLNNFALSSINEFKIAVVDIQKIVSNSSEVKDLKTEQQNKIKDLQTFIEKAKKDVNAQTDETKKKTLEDSYNKELNVRTKTIEKDYSQKLKAIDSNISTLIAKEAKAKSYNMVIAKGVVLYGGDDITDNIIKTMK